MTQRIVWPIFAALGLGGLLLIFTQTSAQRAPEGREQPRAGGPMGPMPGMPMPGPGRFVVANASSSQVLILDTATGQVYRALEKDFKSLSELPRIPAGPVPPRQMDRDGRPGERRPQPEGTGDQQRGRDRRQPAPARDGNERRDPDPNRRP